MNAKYSYLNLFPSPLHIFDIDEFDKLQDDLIDQIYKLKKQDSNGHIISNRGGWQSKGFDLSFDGGVLHTTILKVLKSSFFIKNTTSMVTSAWVNINSPGAYNVRHSHPESNLSGVLWVKCPKDSGKIKFFNSKNFETYTEINSYIKEFKERNLIHEVYWFEPREGRMIIFPSYLEHQVTENKSSEDRISISFNINLTNFRTGRST